MAVRTQVVTLAGGASTWTVVGADGLPVSEVEGFLEYLRLTGCSPNTVRSYAGGAALWWGFMSAGGLDWRRVGVADVGSFLSWLRFGRGAEPSEATVASRLAAVVAFYRFHETYSGVDVARRITTVGGRWRGPYRGMLGLAAIGVERTGNEPSHDRRFPAGDNIAGPIESGPDHEPDRVIVSMAELPPPTPLAQDRHLTPGQRLQLGENLSCTRRAPLSCDPGSKRPTASRALMAAMTSPIAAAAQVVRSAPVRCRASATRREASSRRYSRAARCRSDGSLSSSTMRRWFHTLVTRVPEFGTVGGRQPSKIRKCSDGSPGL
jgi:integrase family protein with SAM-like domain